MSKDTRIIKDSGQRRQFETGAVRDIQEGKGRMDLVPLDVLSPLMEDDSCAQVIHHIGEFMQTGSTYHLYSAIVAFNSIAGWTISQSIIEVSKHYENGANKYGERNWEKGISLHSYIDSGVRHFMKHIAGEIDEPHDRAFIWNMLGAIWTMKHHPELIDIPFDMLGVGHSDATQVVKMAAQISGDELLQKLMDSVKADK